MATKKSRRRRKKTYSSAATATHALEEVGDGHIQQLGRVVQAACADAVGSPLVLLHLLKSDSQTFGKLFLA